MIVKQLNELKPLNMIPWMNGMTYVDDDDDEDLLGHPIEKVKRDYMSSETNSKIGRVIKEPTMLTKVLGESVYQRRREQIKNLKI
jgi:hypothetical protein